MTFRQLETFLAVARAKNFTRAAEALHVSQSTLSQHVLELERELGVRVFDRLGRAVTLPEAVRLVQVPAYAIGASISVPLPPVCRVSRVLRRSLHNSHTTT